LSQRHLERSGPPPPPRDVKTGASAGDIPDHEHSEGCTGLMLIRVIVPASWRRGSLDGSYLGPRNCTVILLAYQPYFCATSLGSRWKNRGKIEVTSKKASSHSIIR
jgi:hypothetical protein